MTKNYSLEEINLIIISKPLSNFYLAIIENRGELLTDEEYEQIIRRDNNVYTGASKKEIDHIEDNFQANKNLKGFVPDLMKWLF